MWILSILRLSSSRPSYITVHLVDVLYDHPENYRTVAGCVHRPKRIIFEITGSKPEAVKLRPEYGGLKDN